MENTVINMPRGFVIYNFCIKDNIVEFLAPGSVLRITDPQEVGIIKQWIKEAKGFAKCRDEICSYLEYMFDFGQYE